MTKCSPKTGLSHTVGSHGWYCRRNKTLREDWEPLFPLTYDQNKGKRVGFIPHFNISYRESRLFSWSSLKGVDISRVLWNHPVPRFPSATWMWESNPSVYQNLEVYQIHSDIKSLLENSCTHLKKIYWSPPRFKALTQVQIQQRMGQKSLPHKDSKQVTCHRVSDNWVHKER